MSELDGKFGGRGECGGRKYVMGMIKELRVIFFYFCVGYY